MSDSISRDEVATMLRMALDAAHQAYKVKYGQPSSTVWEAAIATLPPPAPPKCAGWVCPNGSDCRVVWSGNRESCNAIGSVRCARPGCGLKRAEHEQAAQPAAITSGGACGNHGRYVGTSCPACACGQPPRTAAQAEDALPEVKGYCPTLGNNERRCCPIWTAEALHAAATKARAERDAARGARDYWRIEANEAYQQRDAAKRELAEAKAALATARADERARVAVVLNNNGYYMAAGLVGSTRDPEQP